MLLYIFHVALVAVLTDGHRQIAEAGAVPKLVALLADESRVTSHELVCIAYYRYRHQINQNMSLAESERNQSCSVVGSEPGPSSGSKRVIESSRVESSITASEIIDVNTRDDSVRI